MKTLLNLFLLIATISSLNAQVGINTTTPDISSILDIESSDKGLLIPRLTTTERNTIVSPANGLLIYNTDSDEFQFNSNTPATPIWDAFSIIPTATATAGQSVKYSNTDITTDVNQNTAINLPICGTLNWNDNTTLYVVNTTNNSITVNETGRYRITINASLLTVSGNDRLAPQMRITVNGTQVGTFSSTGYIRTATLNQESSLHINEVLEFNATDIIAIDILREAGAGPVNLKSAGSSNIYIEKIL